MGVFGGTLGIFGNLRSSSMGAKWAKARPDFFPKINSFFQKKLQNF